MKERFFTSTEASQITGCSRRQLQHWRKQEIVVPTVNPSGKGRNVYYSELDLLNLLIMRYLLSRGLCFEASLFLLSYFKKTGFLNSVKDWIRFPPTAISLEPESFKLGFLQMRDTVDTVVNEYKIVIPISGEYICNKLQDNLHKFNNK